MRYEELESWQLDELAKRVHEMVGYFNRLKRRATAKHLEHDRIGELVGKTADDLHSLWVHLHYASCDAGRRERDKFGERKKRPSPEE